MSDSISSKIKVSIITPFFNVEPYIDRFLTMARLQTLEDIEIILIDDAGSDKSRSIAEAHAAQDARIRIVTNRENVGLGKSRNIGIELAQGEYLTFPDSDDWVDANFYEALYATAECEDFPDIVRGALVSDVCGQERMQERIGKRIQEGMANGVPLWATFTSLQPTAIFHRRLFVEAGVRHGTARSSEDQVFLLQACHAAKSFAFCTDSAAYHYLYRSNSIMHQATQAKYLQDMASFAEQIDYALENLAPDVHFYDYFALQTKTYLKALRRIINPDLAYEQAYPQHLRVQVMRLPEPKKLLGHYREVDLLVEDQLRAFELPARPFFSVILPVRNMERTLARAIESILRQDFSSYELIVVINDSSDNTASLAHEYARRFPQIQIHELTLSGVSNARNIGLAAARGRYVLFCDADDFYLPDALTSFYEALKNASFDVALSVSPRSPGTPTSGNAYAFDPAQLLYYLDYHDRLTAPQFPLPLGGLPIVHSQCGNAYRAHFLQHADIGFDPELLIDECAYFNRDVFMHAQSAAIVDTKTYHYSWYESNRECKSLTQLQAMSTSFEHIVDRWNTEDATIAHRYCLTALRLICTYAVESRQEDQLLWLESFLKNPYSQKVLLEASHKEQENIKRLLHNCPFVESLFDGNNLNDSLLRWQRGKR